jgi:hypothetical protein
MATRLGVVLVCYFNSTNISKQPLLIISASDLLSSEEYQPYLTSPFGHDPRKTFYSCTAVPWFAARLSILIYDTYHVRGNLNTFSVAYHHVFPVSLRRLKTAHRMSVRRVAVPTTFITYRYDKDV